MSREAVSTWYAAGNGSVLFIGGERAADYLGSYSVNFLTAETATEGIIRKTSAIPGAALLRFVAGMSPIGDDEIPTEVRMVIYGDPASKTLIVAVTAMFDLDIAIRLLPGVRGEFFRRYSGRLGNRYCLKLVSGQEALYLMPDGKMSVDGRRMLLRIRQGTSRLLIGALSEEQGIERFRYLLSRTPPVPVYAAAPSNPVYRLLERKRREASGDRGDLRRMPENFRSLILYCRERVFFLQAKEGGFFCPDRPTSLADMCRVFFYLIEEGNRTQADAFVSFLYRLREEHGGRLPIACRPDGTGAIPAENIPNPVGDAALILLFEYEARFGLPRDPGFPAFAESILKNDSRFVKGGMMPCSGLEDCFLDGSMQPCRRFHGSLEATMVFLCAAERYLDGMADRAASQQYRRIRSLADFTAGKLRDNFCDGNIVYKNAPRRAGLSVRAHIITGLCDGCGSLGRLIRRADGYFCRPCLTTAPSPSQPPEERIRCETAPFLEAQFGQKLLPETVGRRILRPDRLSVDELISGIGCYAGQEEEQRRFLSELIARWECDPQSVGFGRLCHAAGLILRQTRRKTRQKGAKAPAFAPKEEHEPKRKNGGTPLP